MVIGIDMSQAIYNGGVSNLLIELVSNLVKSDGRNEYILMFSSLRKKPSYEILERLKGINVKFKFLKFPPVLLDFLWNRLHVLPIEIFLGDLDIYISSDWTEPPVKNAKKVTILYDLVVLKVPNETNKRIISVQKRKLEWVKKESKAIICISNSTKKDAEELLGIASDRLEVVYPGIF